MDRALNPVLASPPHHLARGRTVLDAAKADLSEQLDAGGRQFLEVLLDHLVLDHRRAGMNLHAARAERPERALRKDGHRFQADDVARPAGHVNLARRNHRCDAAVQKTVYPADLVLPRRPVASDRMNMAVDQPGRYGGTTGIYDGSGALAIDVLGAAYACDLSVLRNDRVGIQDRLFHRPAQQQPDVPDHQLGWTSGQGFIVGHD